MSNASLVTIFLVSFLLGWAPALYPGQTLRLTVSEFPRRGVAAGLHAWLVQVAVELAFCLLVIGLVLLLRSDGVFAGLLNGLAILTLLAGGWLLMARSSQAESLPARAGVQSEKRFVLTHFVSIVKAPLWWAWWILVGAFLVVDSLGPQPGESLVRFSAFYVGFSLPALIWNLTVARSLEEHWGSRWGRPTFIAYRWNRILISLAGTFMAVRGVTLLYNLISQAAVTWARDAWG